MKNLFWISGSSIDSKKELNKILLEYKDYDIIKVNSNTKFSDLDEAFYQRTCFSNGNLIIISELPTGSLSKNTIVNNIKKFIDNNTTSDVCIIFDNFSGEGTKPFYDISKSKGNVIEFDFTLSKENAPYWVINEFKEYDKNISEEDAIELIRINSFDADRKGIGVDVLKIAVKKISQFLGRRKNIETRDILINSFPSVEFIIWDIFAAMDNKDLCQCYSCFNDLLSDQDNNSSAVFQILSVALWRYRLLFFLKECMAKDKNKVNAANEAANLYKIATEGKGFLMTCNLEKDDKGIDKKAYSSYQINKEINGNYGSSSSIDKYTRKDLLKIEQCILEGISQMRFRTDATVLFLIDALFMTACNTIAEDNIYKLKSFLEE